MRGQTGRSRGLHEQGADAIADWIEGQKAVVYALVALRQLGATADDAIAAVLDVPSIRAFVASWDLWEVLVESDGGKGEELLENRLPRGLLEAARLAMGKQAAVLELLASS
jgi:hypothetical protein